MSHTPNEIADLFPDDAGTVHQLKAENAHFSRLADEYHELNRAVHRIEVGIDAVSDVHAETLKKQRLALLDSISAGIAAARTTVAK